jgi:hypothetical protein
MVNVTTLLSLTELLLTIGRQEWVNEHFAPSSSLCDIGIIPYDFIGDIDNPAHTEYILKKIRFPKPIPKKTVVSESLSHEDLKVACNRETVRIAERIYARDLAAYGYTMEAAYASCEKYGLAFPPV